MTKPTDGVIVAAPSLSEVISRNVTLAAVLEPIADKPGCTTRYVDLKPSKALEYFLTGGVNIGPAFAHLVKHVNSRNTGRGVYKYFVEAIAYSKANRAGGKINQGIIEPLIPIVTAQVMFDPKAEKTPKYVLNKTKTVMKTSSKYDVHRLIEGKQFANALSNFNRQPVLKHNVDSVYEYYAADLVASRDLKSAGFNEEYVDSFPRIYQSYQNIKRSQKVKISDKLADAYLDLFRTYPKAALGVGSAADYVACGLFLYLSYAGDKTIVV